MYLKCSKICRNGKFYLQFVTTVEDKLEESTRYPHNAGLQCVCCSGPMYDQFSRLK